MTQTVRLTGRQSLLSVIPLLLGFYPQDSLCLVMLRGAKVGPVARIDLADLADPGVPGKLADVAARTADEVVLVVYAGPDTAYDVGEVARVIAGKVPVAECIEVGNTPAELHLGLHAERVGNGGVVADTRESLRSRVEYDPSAGGQPQAWIVARMANAGLRDSFLAAHMGQANTTLQVVLAACRAVPDTGAGPLADLCSVAAAFAYRTGDGALALICLDRALRVDPAHRLSHLLQQVMAIAMPPEALDEMVKDLPQSAQ